MNRPSQNSPRLNTKTTWRSVGKVESTSITKQIPNKFCPIKKQNSLSPKNANIFTRCLSYKAIKPHQPSQSNNLHINKLSDYQLNTQQPEIQTSNHKTEIQRKCSLNSLFKYTSPLNHKRQDSSTNVQTLCNSIGGLIFSDNLNSKTWMKLIQCYKRQLMGFKQLVFSEIQQLKKEMMSMVFSLSVRYQNQVQLLRQQKFKSNGSHQINVIQKSNLTNNNNFSFLDEYQIGQIKHLSKNKKDKIDDFIKDVNCELKKSYIFHNNILEEQPLNTKPQILHVENQYSSQNISNSNSENSENNYYQSCDLNSRISQKKQNKKVAFIQNILEENNFDFGSKKFFKAPFIQQKTHEKSEFKSDYFTKR